MELNENGLLSEEEYKFLYNINKEKAKKNGIIISIALNTFKVFANILKR